MKLLESDREMVKELLSMRGKSLGCWCHPEACHGDVLVELMEVYGARSRDAD